MLEGKISDQVMADLNYQVEAAGKEPEDVAHTFLQQLGLTP